ncbi:MULTISPECIES: SHOCT domain-containing protein [unclassified Streptomyces]|uniref:SHOCT domain-containing protein n=1 Tax=unclassified Streptomyces TaxID=2593676 RepID=UPI0023671491|nr:MULTISPECIES: SHOCT domain-containing protein [unclassified Streptomyces]MDF3146398.1 SHOCT domain-containing protein [Streptomyces sp. T21Q-yed]WDF37771.1 SHOCT domain-containing protein [Streptomyces sp. T12]
MDYPLLNAFLTMLWFFLWVMWFVLLFRVIGDIFRDDDMGGWGKAGWTVFVCALPFLGVFVYLIARGRGMGERDVRQMQRQEDAFRSYVQEAAAGAPATGAPQATRVDELTKLAGLHDHGDITDAEYERAKAKVLAG